jgi:hypothetical protein
MSRAAANAISASSRRRRPCRQLRAGVALAAAQARDLALERLVEDDRLARSLGATPLAAEIAERLVLSTRTIDMHMRNILAKLRCRTRTQAARRASELAERPEPTERPRCAARGAPAGDVRDRERDAALVAGDHINKAASRSGGPDDVVVRITSAAAIAQPSPIWAARTRRRRRRAAAGDRGSGRRAGRVTIESLPQ